MSDFRQVSKNPMNRSISKQLYSFPRASRFSLSKEVGCNTFYEQKVSAFGHRAPSFGYGDKMTLESKQKVPPPGQYQKHSEFLINKRVKRGYSFGGEPKRGIINEEEALRVPGPGKYQCKPSNERFKKVSFTIRSKHQDPLERHKSLLGPGQYATLPTINPEGKYFIAKYRSSGCSKIGNTQRFKETDNSGPGPGKYESQQATNINTTGHYFYSGIKTVQTSAFSISPRKAINQKSISPGPGAYGYFSEFPSRN